MYNTLMAEGENIAPEPQTPWQFNPGDIFAPGGNNQNQELPQQQPAQVEPSATAIPPEGPDGSITWTASEFVAHHKSSGWYLGLAVLAVVVSALVWLLTKDKVSAGVVLVGAVVFGAYAARQPRQLEYRLDQQGLSIGRRHFSYQEFRSFSLMPEGAFQSIAFVPLKRFAPLTTIYFDPSDQTKITALLSERLPYEERQKDAIDKLMWRIRF